MTLDEMEVEAMLYQQLDDKRVRCQLCSHYCVISEGKKGVCQVRENRDGVLYTLVYGRTISQNVDPVEKKPLYHFLPGTWIYSIATPGCNFRCPWCQNWQISQMPREMDLITGQGVSPVEIVDLALQANCSAIAYTYTEPTIFFEYAFDTARKGHQAGLGNVFVTNGYMTDLMLQKMHPFLDAANVDLKAFSKETYNHSIGAGFQPVLDNMKLMKKLGIWLEVTTLIIPDLNDSPAELRQAAQFIAHELGVNTPWHLSRFFPGYRMTGRGPTSIDSLRQAEEIGRAEGLQHIYIGNVPGGSDTVCPNCGKTLIQRNGYHINENNLIDSSCPECGTAISGVWSMKELEK